MNQKYNDTTLKIIKKRIEELEWALGDAGREKALHIKNEIKVFERIRKAHLEDVQYWADKTKFGETQQMSNGLNALERC